MRRIMLLVTVAAMLALMLALSGPALANHGAAHGGGGHVHEEEVGLTFTGGGGGTVDDQSGGGGHVTGDFFDLGVLIFNVGAGSGGSDQGGGGGGGGCVTFFGERECGSLSRILPTGS